MKKSIIARIAVYALLVLILAGLLIGGLCSPGIPMFSFRGSSYSGDETESHQGSVSASQVRDLDISWASGSITVVPGDTDEIRFSETETSGHTMVWHVSDETLVIEFSDRIFSFGFRPGKAKKDLTVTVPRNWIGGNIEIDAASTEVQISGLTFDGLDIDGASNRASLTDCTVHDVTLDGASNRLRFEGSLEELDSDGASNDCTLILTNHVKEIEMDGVSSRLTLTAPEDFGFTVDADGLSFDFSSDFEVIRHSKNHIPSGDGRCLISVDGVSTSLEILRAK